uniref:NADH-ubiquinone oxidoreductase chain 5 n=1 Tax=Pseudorimula sp. RSIO35641 TaxID=2652779 RepID=A0A5J6VB77_9VEST|nr:NADH dehydrogenase subunit 5 [Pseudorimula sp. RSIO35641]
MGLLKMTITPKSPSISSLILFFISLSLAPVTLFFIYTNSCFLIEWEMLNISSTSMTIPLILDPVGLIFSNVVCLISACVMFFSTSYMANDPHLPRFTWLVMLFVLSMNLLIFIPSLVSLLIGWDGLGIVSFALVIYYPNMKSLSAGMITALMNRIGDVMLLTAIGLSSIQGHWNIMFMWDTPFTPAMALCLVIAGMTKSAQIPFSAWLPAAMAAPTPVSALVHSSTLVTAGVFLLIRFFPLINSFKPVMTMLLFIAVLTMFMAGISANYEYDLKKVIALSTLSQLGVMMTSLSLGYPGLTLFHLLTHALFKAMLFLCAGAIIHNNTDTQDLRNLGNLWAQMPLTVSCLNVANLALCGAPFLSGFYSKDLILESSLMSPSNTLMILMIFLATGMTAAYSLRLSFYSLWTDSNHLPFHQIHDEDSSVTTPIMILTIITIFIGSLMQNLTADFSNFSAIPLSHKLLVIFVILMGAWLATLMWTSPKNSPTQNHLINSMNSSMWFLALNSAQPIIFYPLLKGKQAFSVLDQGWLELSGGQGTMALAKKMTQINQLFQAKLLTVLISTSAISLTTFFLLMAY